MSPEERSFQACVVQEKRSCFVYLNILVFTFTLSSGMGWGYTPEVLFTSSFPCLPLQVEWVHPEKIVRCLLEFRIILWRDTEWDMDTIGKGILVFTLKSNNRVVKLGHHQKMIFSEIVGCILLFSTTYLKNAHTQKVALCCIKQLRYGLLKFKLLHTKAYLVLGSSDK